MICKLFRFEKVTLFLNNSTAENKFDKVYQHNLNVFSDMYSNELLFEKNLQYLTLEDKKVDTLKKLYKIFNDDKYIYTQDFEILTDDFYNIQFIPDVKNKINEFFSYYFESNSKVVGYITFEKYNFSEALTERQLIELKTMCNLLNTKFSNVLKGKQLSKEISIYKSILSDAEINILIIKKNTYEILYYNELLKRSLPQLKLGLPCFNLKGLTEPCNSCCIKGDKNKHNLCFLNSSEYVKIDTSPITWDNDLDAFIMCARKVGITEYQEEINLNEVDLLTKSPKLEKFKEDFKEYVVPKFNDYKYSILYFDLEKFSNINAVHGYTIGDEVLKKLTICLKNVLKFNELFCRIGEDKFIVLCSYENDIDLKSRINIFNYEFSKMQTQFFNKINLIFICGVCKLDKSEDLLIVIDNANIARKSIKGSLKNTYRIYDESLKGFIKKNSLLKKWQLRDWKIMNLFHTYKQNST